VKLTPGRHASSYVGGGVSFPFASISKINSVQVDAIEVEKPLKV
jgi:hypothetical protein